MMASRCVLSDSVQRTQGCCPGTKRRDSKHSAPGGTKSETKVVPTRSASVDCFDVLTKPRNPNQLEEHIAYEQKTEDIEVPKLSIDATKFEARQITSGETCLFATQNIAKGELVFCEEPLLACMSGDDHEIEPWNLESDAPLKRKINALSKDKQDLFFSLPTETTRHSGSNKKGANKIYSTNYIPLEQTLVAGTGVFLIASRLQHSCLPNVEHFFEESSKTVRFVAARNITEGDMLCICYVNPLQSHHKRQTQLLKQFDLSCRCTICTKPEHELKLSDSHREKLNSLDERLELSLTNSCLEGAVRLVRETMRLLREEKLDTPKHLLKFEYDGWQANLRTGDIYNAETCFDRAYEYSIQAYGSSSCETKKLLQQADGTMHAFSAIRDALG